MGKCIFQRIRYVGTACTIILMCACQSSDPVDFSTQIKPILNDKCITCHGGVKKNGGFSLLFKEEAFAVTESGKPAIIPGNASGSEFIKRLHEEDPELRMPYEKPKLSDEEIDLLTRWVDQGAPWGQHWAYVLPEKVNVPAIEAQAGFAPGHTSDFIRNPIDNFILARLQNEGIQPNAVAEKNTLARRVALDITGLPPSKTFFSSFDKGVLSYEQLVDSLLLQKAYGEKWASWWLDMARYADSKGYEKDMGREIWAYRDWVIRSLNEDMSYDRFTTAQLAGDLLPEPSLDQLIATAFHRNTMNNDEGGTDDEEFRVATVIDRTNTTFEVWQSTTIGCVQCHSHPYDPFTQKEYFKIMAFFNNTRDEDTPNESPILKFYSAEQKEKGNSVTAWAKKYGNDTLAMAYRNFIRYREPVYKSHFFEDFVNGAYDDHASVVLWDKGSCKMPDIKTRNAGFIYLNFSSHYEGTKIRIRKGHKEGTVLADFKVGKTQGNVTQRFPFNKIDERTDLYIETYNPAALPKAGVLNLYWVAFLEDLPGQEKSGYREVGKNFMELLNARTPSVPIMVENPEYMKRTTQVFDRGSWLTKTDTVQAGTPKTLNPWNEAWPKDRLGLARWIVDKNNPLTARTLVNRVWHQLFGLGLVPTVEDIGSQSDAPSHPALLDWLALRFMNEHQWSIKSLVREIVLSGTYRQSSESNPEMYQVDPKNELYARGPRQRLGAEQIRDQALAVSGLLSPKMYGPGVMPPQPEGVWQTVYNDHQWVESKGEDRYRRGVYTYLKRTSPYPSFLTFDAGSREVCMIRRTVTNTPLQALVTLNDPVYLEAAYHLAKNSFNEDNIPLSIAKSYQAATYKSINPSTRAILKQLYTESLEELTENPAAVKELLHFEENPGPELAAMTIVTNAIMNLDEFLTKA
ncbi:MAG: PSD1 and planctomycete cytochrome C domain-containing protein [Bacteroidota bacterium]